jgi:hypothetical protein
MDNQEYHCSICGLVTDTPGEQHKCATLNAIIFERGKEPAPRSSIDALMRNIVKSIHDHLLEWLELPDEQTDPIHPRMLAATISSNVIINLFDELVQDNLPPHVKKLMLGELLDGIRDMCLQAHEALLKGKIILKNKKKKD